MTLTKNCRGFSQVFFYLFSVAKKFILVVDNEKKQCNNDSCCLVKVNNLSCNSLTLFSFIKLQKIKDYGCRANAEHKYIECFCRRKMPCQ